ncbi:MAG TPA: hypothetical protein VJR89_08145, partial [Polyangiales bacterium]|nr:hypothetical protein [Polyangiales bacterium]
VELTLRTLDADDIRAEAGTIYFNDSDIHVPPFALASASMSCPLPEDMHLLLLWSHMHARGVRFVVETDDPAAAAMLGSPLYEARGWAEPQAKSYPVRRDAVLHAGSRIHFRCEYENDGERTYRFGSSAATDEMCILHGMYWPRTSRDYEQCLIGRMTSTSRSAVPSYR